PAIMSELFPTRLRGLGIGAWYNLTVALFGGTAPLVIQWQHRPQQLVLLVCRGRRSRRVRRHTDPPGDQGVGAQVRSAFNVRFGSLADLRSAYAGCPL